MKAMGKTTRMAKRGLCLIGILFSFSLLHAQNYTRDAGIRFGDGTVFAYRQFVKDDLALELFLVFQDRGFRVGGMKQHFLPAFEQYSENFKLYYGYGVHTGISYTNKHQLLNRTYYYDWTLSPLFGMDGIIGLEYYFPEVPIMVSSELKPFFEFSINRIFILRPVNMSISVKYRF